jgi:hypothetical protein
MPGPGTGVSGGRMARRDGPQRLVRAENAGRKATGHARRSRPGKFRRS